VWSGRPGAGEHDAARVEDRFAPAASLPPAPAGRRVRLAPVARAAAEQPRLEAALADARRVRDGLADGVPRAELSAVIATTEALGVTRAA
jgi:hypothetical protein